MTDLGDLYQALILDHAAHPHNFGPLDGASHRARGHNPLCGDRYEVSLKIENDVVRDVRFTGDGCAISKASASLMTKALLGKTTVEAHEIFELFHRLATGENVTTEEREALGKLTAFAGVQEFPGRVKCATLSWHTAMGALAGERAVTTE